MAGNHGNYTLNQFYIVSRTEHLWDGEKLVCEYYQRPRRRNQSPFNYSSLKTSLVNGAVLQRENRIINSYFLNSTSLFYCHLCIALVNLLYSVKVKISD